MDAWQDTNTKYKIYKYATMGFSQSHIAKVLLKIDPGYVNRIVKKLIADGYIEEVKEKILINGKPIYKRVWPILYKPTDIIYPLDAAILPKKTSGVLNDPRINLICLQYNIIKPIELEPAGHKWINKNTEYIDLKEIFPIGVVTFRLINKTKLIVWLPEKQIGKEHLRNIKDKAYVMAQSYVAWFEKKYRCRVGLPEIYQDYHIAFTESDPLLNDLVKQHGILKLIDADGRVISWWDQSKGIPEYETQDERLAEARAFYPNKIVILEDKLYHLEEQITRMENSINGLVEKIDSLFSPPRPDGRLEEIERGML